MNTDQSVNREAKVEANSNDPVAGENRIKSVEEKDDPILETSKPYHEKANHADDPKTNAK